MADYQASQDPRSLFDDSDEVEVLEIPDATQEAPAAPPQPPKQQKRTPTTLKTQQAKGEVKIQAAPSSEIKKSRKRKESSVQTIDATEIQKSNAALGLIMKPTGSRLEVILGKAERTKGGLRPDGLIVKIISKKASERAKSNVDKLRKGKAAKAAKLAQSASSSN
jgi:hypothetical protein